MFVVHAFFLVPLLLVPLAASACFVAGRWRWAGAAAAGVALLGAEALLLLDNQAEFNDFKAIYAPLHTPDARVVAERAVAARRLRAAGRLHRTRRHRHLQQCRHARRARPAADLRAVPRRQPHRRPAEAGRARCRLCRRGAGRAAVSTDPACERAAGRRLGRLPHRRGPGARRSACPRAGAGAGPAARAGATVWARRPPGRATAACSLSGEGPVAAVRDGGSYDIIDLSADFLDAAEANATAFTVQALADYLRALAPGGIVSIPVSIRDFPVYALRVLATGAGRIAGRRHRRPGGAHRGLSLRLERAHPAVQPTPGTPSASPRCGSSATSARSTCRGIRAWIPSPRAPSIYNDLPAVSFASGEVTSDGPDDSIADEARRGAGGRARRHRGRRSTWRRSRWTGRSSMPCCGWISSTRS